MEALERSPKSFNQVASCEDLDCSVWNPPSSQFSWSCGQRGVDGAEADAAMPLAWLETTYDRCSSTETIDQLVNQQIYLIFLSLWKLILSNSFSTTSAVFLHDHRRFCWGKNNLCYLSEGFFEWCHINLSPQSRSDRLQGFSVCNS